MLCGWEGRTALSRYRPCAHGARAPHGPRRAPVLQCTAHWPGTTSRVSTSERKSVPINVPIYNSTSTNLADFPEKASKQESDVSMRPYRPYIMYLLRSGGWRESTA